MTRSRPLAALIALAAAPAGCAGAERGEPDPLVIDVPANLGRPVVSPDRNPLTVQGAALGRRLFFDPRLSGDNRVACSTCHTPALAFSDVERLREGAAGRPLLRHTPALQNLAWMSGYFWDGGGHDLESQVFGPLSSPDEMAQPVAELLGELAQDAGYLEAFELAFPDGLTIANVARAIAQFERTLISAGSRYDRFVRGEPGGTLSPLEERGLAVFGERCAGCHTPDFFTDDDYHNNGLDEVFPDDHERVAWGRGRISNSAADIGKYKTPSLRNVALTAPYMHDGRLATLEDVLEHYRSGVRASATLDPALSPPGLPLDDDDAAAIIAFLGTLTDTDYTEQLAGPASP